MGQAQSNLSPGAKAAIGVGATVGAIVLLYALYKYVVKFFGVGGGLVQAMAESTWIFSGV